MKEHTIAAQRRLALVMLGAGLLGQLAYAMVTYNAGRSDLPASTLFSVASLMRYLPWACWSILLIRSGWGRWWVGTASFVCVLLLAYGSEVTAMRLAVHRSIAEIRTEYGKPGDVEEKDIIPGSAVVLPDLEDLAGNSFSLASYGDRPVVLSFWRSWCMPCRSEVPDLNRLDQLETAAGFVAVVGMNDEECGLQSAAARDLGIGFRLVRYSDETLPFDVSKFPTTVVIREGRVVSAWTGRVQEVVQKVVEIVEGPGGAQLHGGS